MKSVDAMEMCLKDNTSSVEETIKDQEKHKEECGEEEQGEDEVLKISEAIHLRNCKEVDAEKNDVSEVNETFQEKAFIQETTKHKQDKVAVLYELLSACVADLSEDQKGESKQRKGYDARHRVALRLLATWFDIKWDKVVSLYSNCFSFVCYGSWTSSLF